MPRKSKTMQREGPDLREDQSMNALSLHSLAELQVRRKYLIKQVNRSTNAAGALVRRALGWDPEDSEEKNKKLKAEAAKIVSAALAGKGCALAAVAADLEVTGQMLVPPQKARHQVELDMKRFARSLPIWTAWAKNVRGLGELGLAVIIAETGDLSKYSNPGKVWKRLGLAPFNGKAMSTHRKEGGLTADEWTVAGYSPRRRAEIFSCVGDPLFRQQTMITGPYRVAYDKRRAHTAETHSDWTKLHSHNDALRIMTKELIRDLWSEWRRARHCMETNGILPAANNPSQEDGSAAITGLKSNAPMPPPDAHLSAAA